MKLKALTDPVHYHNAALISSMTFATLVSALNVDFNGLTTARMLMPCDASSGAPTFFSAKIYIANQL